MYSSLLIVDDCLTQKKKDFLTNIKKEDVMIVEYDYNEGSFEGLKSHIDDIYQENDVLGDTLELQNIMFYNDKIEYTNSFFSYFGQNTKYNLCDLEIHDPSMISLNSMTEFITNCKNDYSLECFYHFDINHILHNGSWTKIFNKISTDLSGSFMNYEKLNNFDFNIDVHHNEDFQYVLNWMKQCLKNHENETNILKFFNLNNIENNSHLNIENDEDYLLNVAAVRTMSNIVPLTVQESELYIMLIPCINHDNNEVFSQYVKYLNQNQHVCPVLISTNDNVQTITARIVKSMTLYLSSIQSSELKLNLSIYLKPYWNNVEQPIEEIILSNNLQTIPLSISEDSVIDGQLFQSLITLFKTQFSVVQTMNFEIFNMSQNHICLLI